MYKVRILQANAAQVEIQACLDLIGIGENLLATIFEARSECANRGSLRIGYAKNKKT